MNTFRIIEERVQDDIYASQAETADTEAIMSLLYRTAAWLNSKGSTQWNELLQGVDVHGMADSIAKGDVFVFKRGGDPAAVVMLLQQPSAWDRELWSSLCDKGEAGHDDSIYLHRLAIDRAFAGSQLGHAVLRWVEAGIR
ncbi:GNAT family N-acetyltransferase, partial [Bacillus cereus]|nr:GNAT family N-acetyltransferase [Bacillus cereus]